MPVAVKITILVDYAARENLQTEHGFAAWIEAGDERILFDTGQSGAMQANAHALGIDLKRARALVLSHGHFDHTGTLPQFLADNHDAHIYYAHGLHLERYSCKPGTPVRAIGMPEWSRQSLVSVASERLHELTDHGYLAPGIGMTGPVPRISAYEDAGGPFYLDPDSLTDDVIEDDQSMWFETDGGLVVLLGCCHAGVVNTIEYIRKITGIQQVRGIIGGMHLVNADQHRLDQTLDAMKGWQMAFAVPCHCTGTNAAEQMLAVLGDGIVQHGCAGLTVEV